MRGSRHFRLSEPGDSQGRTIRFVSGLPVALAEGLAGDKPTSWVTITRTGKFFDRRYGEFDITRAMLAEMVKNFDAGTYGQEIFLDVSHEPDKGAAAKVIKLAIEGDRLRAQVEWTPYGVEAIKQRGFRYLSAEFHDNWQDNEQRATHGCVLLGAGLTIRPVIKGLDPVSLSEQSDGEGSAIALHPTLLSELINEVRTTMNKHLEQLKADLKAKNLSESAIAAIIKVAEQGMSSMTDDNAMKALCDALLDGAVKLAEAGQTPGSITLSVGLTDADVAKAVAKALADHQTEAKRLAETAAAKVKLLSDTVGEKIKDAELVKELCEPFGDVVGSMTDDQVKNLAVKQIAMGEKLEANKQLASLGFNFRGNAHIELPNEAPKKLGAMIRDALKKTSAFRLGKITLSEKDDPFVEEVLGLFDHTNNERLLSEHRMLSGGSASVGDYYFPAGIQREVIRVALSDLNIMQLVGTRIDPYAQATTEIPFEVRPNYQGANDGVVYEGQGIPRYQITTDHETAWITPMKIGMLWSNELQHFTRRGQVNWDAVAENIAANARTMRELIARRAANGMQRAADSFQSIAVTGENIASQLNGSNSIIKTANFPIVRPFQAYNLKGVAQGSAENPVALVVNGATITQYDGSGTQSAGTYWRILSANLGYIQLLNQAGTPVTPTASSTCTLGYSRVTNIVKVDLDVPGGTEKAKHLNKVLEAVGAQKAMLSGQRYVASDYLLMSPTLNDVATNAEAFVESMKRNGSDTSMQGDLARIKGLPAFGTNQPGIDLGDERILMGPRGLMNYTIAKPYAIEGTPFEVVDANGRATGQKQVYAEEYNAFHVPTPLRGYMTSVLCYSATGR